MALAISHTAIASIVFVGELSPYVLSGLCLILTGTAVVSTYCAVFGRFNATVAVAPIPVVLVMIAIAATIPLQGHELFVTFVVVIIGCTLLSGSLFYAIGYFRIANFLRFIPFNVAAGALAGTGVLVCILSLNIVGFSWSIEDGFSRIDSVVVWQCIVSISFGLVLLVATKYWKSSLSMPVSFAGLCVLYHVVLNYVDIDPAEAIEVGLFFNVSFTESLWPVITWADLAAVDWVAVAGQTLNAMALFLVLIVLTVVSFSQLEIAIASDLDWNREFRVTGIANLLSAAAVGIPAHTSASVTVAMKRLNVDTPVTTIGISLTLAFLLFFGGGVIQFVPKAACSGFLLALGLPMVGDWLIKTKKRLDSIEYFMLVLICLTIVFVGFLQAVVLGIILSLVFFAVRLSQVDAVETRYTLQEKRSHKLRSIPDQAILRLYGERAVIYRLRGYVFFGSAYSFAVNLKNALDGSVKPACVVIDFAAITGFDPSALDSLRGYVHRASGENVTTILSRTSPRLEQEIRRDFPDALIEQIVWAADEEEALILGEEILMDLYMREISRDARLRDVVSADVTAELTKYLERQTVFEELVLELQAYSERLDYADQETIVRAGEEQRGMQFLISGKASINDQAGNRLLEVNAGSVVESSSAVEQQNALHSIVADGACETLLITPNDLAKLESENEQLAMNLYRYVLSTTTATAPE